MMVWISARGAPGTLAGQLPAPKRKLGLAVPFLCAIFLLAARGSAQPANCHAISGDRIRAVDLAAVLPEFAGVPPDTLLGQAPLPGSQRVFHSPELLALAHRFSLKVSPGADACFEWAMGPLDREHVLDVMKESLQIEGAQIEISDLMTARVPPGRLEFPLSKLGTPATAEQRAPVLWRGDVVYGDGHRLPIWARVNISAPCQKLVAVGSLKAGQPIDSHQLRATTSSCFPTFAKDSVSAEQAIGMVPLRALAPGSVVRQEFLAPPNEINRGDNVSIEVHSGAAHLAITAKALTAGRKGETISVRNPQSNRIFQARVTGKGTAIVETGPKGS